jgi:hypothetical protein
MNAIRTPPRLPVAPSRFTAQAAGSGLQAVGTAKEGSEPWEYLQLADHSLPFSSRIPHSAFGRPCSRCSFGREIFHDLNVSRIFAETLTSTGTFKKRAHFDQK